MNLSVMQDGSEQIHYQDPSVPIYVCHGDLIHLSNMAALCHWHEDVELLLSVSGYLSYNINGNILRVEEGNAIFITPRQMHYGFSADGTDCQYICICFKPGLLCGHRYLYDRYVLPITESTGPQYLLIEQGQPEHDRILEHIRHIGESTDRDLALLGKLHELWQGIYNISKIERETFTDPNLEQLKRMLAFINTQYSERVTLSQIAAAGGVCRSKCCEIFRRYMGSTPNEYVTSYRLERAMELLRETELPVTEVANACGFGGSSYFAEVFMKRKGCTPTQYRKRYVRRSSGFA